MSRSIPNPTLQALGKKIAFSTLVQYAGRIVHIGFATLIVKLISNYLSQGDYGIYEAIIEYALFFSVAANLGIFGNVVRRMADEPLNGKIFINAFVLRLVTATVFFAIGVLILFLNGGDSVFLIGSMLFFGTLFFDYVTNVCDAALQANYLMGRATIALVLGRVVHFALVFWVVNFFGEIQTLEAMYLLFGCAVGGAFVTAALSFYFVRQKIRWSFSVDAEFMGQILRVSIPFGLINIFNNLYFRFIPSYLAFNALSDAEYATFNISFRIAMVVSIFSTFLMFSALPGLKEYIDQKHWHKVRYLCKRIWQIVAVGSVLLVVFGSLLGPWMIEVLTHKKYFLPEFWFVLPMMLLLAAISYGYDVILITLFALEKDWWLVKRECVALLLAGTIFALSFAVGGIQEKLLLIIGGAIVGEVFMVVAGMLRMRKEVQHASNDLKA